MHVRGSIMILIRKFKCTCCGACCKLLGLVDKKARELGMCDENGACIYLDKDTNLCTIYDERPLVCRVDDLYGAGYFNDLSKSDYYKMNYESCEKVRKLLEEMGLD